MLRQVIAMRNRQGLADTDLLPIKPKTTLPADSLKDELYGAAGPFSRDVKLTCIPGDPNIFARFAPGTQRTCCRYIAVALLFPGSRYLNRTFQRSGIPCLAFADILWVQRKGPGTIQRPLVTSRR